MGSFIKVYIVNTDPLFSIYLLYHHHIGKPFRVVGFLDEVGLEELVDLLTNHRVLLRIEPSVLLNDRLVGWIYIKPMDNDRRINVRHVFMGPSEDIPVLLEEVHKLVSEASKQL